MAATAACLLLALAVSLLMTPKYESVSIIEVNKQHSDTLGLEGVSRTGGSDSLDYNITVETQARALRSDSLAFQVAEQLGLEKRKEFSLADELLDSDRARAEQKLPLHSAPKTAENLASLRAGLKGKGASRHAHDRSALPQPRPAGCRQRGQYAGSRLPGAVFSHPLSGYRDRPPSGCRNNWRSCDRKVKAAQEKVVAYQKQAGILGTDEAHNVVTAKLEELNRQLTAAEANRMLKQAGYQIARTERRVDLERRRQQPAGQPGRHEQ